MRSNQFHRNVFLACKGYDWDTDGYCKGFDWCEGYDLSTGAKDMTGTHCLAVQDTCAQDTRCKAVDFKTKVQIS